MKSLREEIEFLLYDNNIHLAGPLSEDILKLFKKRIDELYKNITHEDAWAVLKLIKEEIKK